jgi:hypothetical protein
MSERIFRPDFTPDEFTQAEGRPREDLIVDAWQHAFLICIYCEGILIVDDEPLTDSTGCDV